MPATRGKADALIVVDVQNDFLPGGRLAVPGGGEIISVLNSYIDWFVRKQFPIFATRDWHPPDHCSFTAHGGSWPAHCLMETNGAQFARGLTLPAGVRVVSKGTLPAREAYSAFEGTDLESQLRELSVECLYVGGLATDYCVLNTVKDGLQRGFKVKLLEDAVRAVNVAPDDGRKALEEMKRLGAITLDFKILSAAEREREGGP